jgi:hypothetical protein
MNKTNDGGVLGRIIALSLIVGAAYGAHAIERGTFGCGFGGGHSCMMEAPAASAPDAQPVVPSKNAE